MYIVCIMIIYVCMYLNKVAFRGRKEAFARTENRMAP